MADIIDPEIAAGDAAAEALLRRGTDSTTPEVDPARESALDSAFAEVSKQAPPQDETEENFGRSNGGVERVTPGTPKEEKKPEPAVEPAKEPAATEPEKPTEEAAPSKSLLDSLVGDSKPAAEKPAEDPYGNVKLRSDASPKTRETFDELKRIAKEREESARAEASTAKQELEQLRTKVAELEKKSTTVPDDVQNELKELRAFRAQFDTQNDPEFRQKFDSRIDQNYSTVFDVLKKHGLPDGEVAKLRGFSPAERDAAIETFLDKLPTIDRKRIEAKLLDNVNVSEERERALAEARTKADEILAKQKQAPEQQSQQRIAQVAEILKPQLAKLPFLHPKEIPANAAPEEKKRLEAENNFAAAAQEALRRQIVDQSPETVAAAAIAVPLALHLRQVNAALLQRAEAAEKQLAAIKNASATSRTARSIGNAAAPAPAAPKAHENSEDAVDALFSEVTGTKFN